MTFSRLTRFLFWTVFATAATFGLFIIYAKLTGLPVGPSQKSWAHDVVARGDPGIKYVMMLSAMTAMFFFFLIKLMAEAYNWLRGVSNAAWNPRMPLLYWAMFLFLPGVSQIPVIVLVNLIKDFSIDPALVEIEATLFIVLLTLWPLLGLSAMTDWACGRDV